MYNVSVILVPLRQRGTLKCDSSTAHSPPQTFEYDIIVLNWPIRNNNFIQTRGTGQHVLIRKVLISDALALIPYLILW